jgi:L-ascorbate metabolism protein UlaG (beta-lactamase superfamily)
MRSPEFLERCRRSPAWDGRRFDNLEPTRVFVGENGFPAWRYLAERKDREPAVPLEATSIHRNDFEDPLPERLRFVWLGHSTVLLDLDGVRVLTDPVWARRVSPVPFAGPLRFLPSPIPLEELPNPDLVLLSHDHYDHLDAATVRALGVRRVRFVTPLGVGRRLVRMGVSEDLVTELDWGEEAWDPSRRLKVVATPSRHFSGRGGIDANTTLWCSFVLVGATHRVFFGGDGGLSASHAEIGQQHGPFDLSLLEIGAFDPSWNMIHLGPENAVEAQRRLRSSLLLPIHWGTYNLAMHPWYEPAETCLAGMGAAGLPVVFPRAGDFVDVGGPLPAPGWWRSAMA